MKIKKQTLSELESAMRMLSREEQSQLMGGDRVEVDVTRSYFGSQSTGSSYVATAYDNNGNAASVITGYLQEGEYTVSGSRNETKELFNLFKEYGGGGITMFLFLACFLSCSFIGFSQTPNGQKELKEAYTSLCEQPSDSVRQVRFFQAYPATFLELQSCFVENRFQSHVIDYVPYLTAFEQLSFISKEKKMSRLFNIVVGGYWQADAPGQHIALMRQLMRKAPRTAFSQIAKEDKVRQILFWQCYWQGPCLDPSQEKDFSIYNSLEGYEVERQIMRDAYITFRATLPVLD